MAIQDTRTETYHVDPEARRDEWLALRQRDVTASNVAAVCGVGYGTVARVYAEKKGLIPGAEMNALMERGLLMEPTILKALQVDRPAWTVRQSRVYLRRPDLRLGATPDFVAIDPEREGFGVIQAKTVAAPVFRTQWFDGDRLAGPIAYHLQTLTEARLAGASWAVLSALVLSDFKFERHYIDVDVSNDAAWERIVLAVANFWEHFDADRMPAIDPERDAETVRLLYAAEDEKEPPKALPFKYRDRLARRHELAAEIRAKTDEMAAIDTEIQGLLGNASIGECGQFRVSWKLQRRKEYTVKATEFRRFTVSTPKELTDGAKANV